MLLKIVFHMTGPLTTAKDYILMADSGTCRPPCLIFNDLIFNSAHCAFTHSFIMRNSLKVAWSPVKVLASIDFAFSTDLTLNENHLAATNAKANMPTADTKSTS